MTAGMAAVFYSLSNALPNAYEVSCRAWAWKCPILLNEKLAPVTWVPRIHGFHGSRRHDIYFSNIMDRKNQKVKHKV